MYILLDMICHFVTIWKMKEHGSPIFCLGCSLPLPSNNISSVNMEMEALRDELTGQLINLSQVALSVTCDKTMTNALLEGLAFTSKTHFSAEECESLIKKTIRVRNSHGYACFFHSKDIAAFDMNEVRNGEPGVSSMKLLILEALRDMAVLVVQARNLGYYENEINDFFYRGLNTMAGTLPYEFLAEDIVTELGHFYLRAMELLATAEGHETSDTFDDSKRKFFALYCPKTANISNILEEINSNSTVILCGCGETFAENSNMAFTDCLNAFRYLKARGVSLECTVFMPWQGANRAALLFCLISLGVKEIFIDPDYPEIMSAEIIHMFKTKYGVNRIPDFKK